MIEKTYCCDRCARSSRQPMDRLTLFTGKPNPLPAYRDLDLCRECMNEFSSFLDDHKRATV